ncbi:hypothetical protein [Spirosoma koreense]
MTRYTDDLKQQVERILRWEPSSHWRWRDFVQLSELVQRHTNQPVDAHELQAFWKSVPMPSPVLLDALARFADYNGWDDFCTRNFYGEMEADDETAMLHAPMWEIPIRWVIRICWFAVILSILIGIVLIWKH